jgi:hypothetical protein
MTEQTNGYDYRLINNIDYHLNLRMLYNYFCPQKKLFIGIYKFGDRNKWNFKTFCFVQAKVYGQILMYGSL